VVFLPRIEALMSRRLAVAVGVLPLIGVAALGVWLLLTGGPASSRAGVDVRAPGESWTAEPRAVVEDAVHDLGVLKPGDQRRHKFVIRNDGAADLVLKLGSTSCKCTLAHFDELRIPPRRSDVIELEWRTEDPQFRFRQGAVINTNDRALPSFELVGEGSVRVKLAALNDTVFLADVPRNTARSLNVLLYSQAYASVEFRKIESSSDAITAVLSEATPTTAPPQETRFLRDLVVSLAPQSKPGRHDATLRLDYVGRLPDGTEEIGTYELPAAFDVAGDVTVHGRDVAGSVLVFGSVSQAVGATKQVYVHVRGFDELKLSVKRANPEVLKISVGEPQTLSPTLTRYPVSVSVPPGTPLLAFTEQSLGEVELATTHADNPVVRIPVSLIVVP
jgi:hypothetical protein